MDVVSPEPEKVDDRLGPVQKSTSLQEFHSRRSLSGISESMASADNFQSSGVYSGSIDISDVCMGDFTKLSESTMCSPSASQGDQALAISTPSYPMMSLRSAQITTDCTPIRNVVELLSPQFGANDEYIHRNIIFIHKQLKSLMLQLATDDKYFQTTVEKYEDIISGLNEEIRNLKNAADADRRRIDTEGKDHQRGCIDSENTLESALTSNALVSEKNSKELGDEVNSLMTNFRSDLLASFRDTLKSSCSTFPDLLEELPQINVDSATPEEILESFQKLVTFSKKITSKHKEANSILSEKLSDSGCVVDRLKSECESSRSEDSQTSVDLKAKLQILLDENSSLKSALNEKNKSERLKELELSKAMEEISELKHNLRSKDFERDQVADALKELEMEHKKLIDEYRIKGSSLILENSKLKQELEESHSALSAAQVSAEKYTEKFDELQKLYSALNEQMRSRESALGEIERQRCNLEEALEGKDSVLERLCSNFNELLAIFRECQNLGLDQDSSATDIDDGFVRLKRRLLDLSQDYITLNNRNKVLEKELVVVSSKLKGKEEETVHARKKMERKSDSLQKTLEKLEAENRELVSQKIEREDSIKRLNEKIQLFETRATAGCQDCSMLKDQLQQMKIDSVHKDSTISSLKLHIQSCCEPTRKKAQQYKHELHALKRLQSSETPYASEFGLSPKKSRSGYSLKTDVGLQVGESLTHSLTGGFVERFKIRELEETVLRLEKEKIVLKRLCKVRSDRISELEPSNSGHTNSSISSHTSK